MAASVVAIGNAALDLLGAAPITSLEDPSKVAGLILRNYGRARDAALRSYPWNCAMRRAQLAAVPAAPAWGFARTFPLPADCLRVMEADGDLAGLRWRIEGRALLCDADGPLNIRYVAQMDDPAEIDALLTDAIAARLAHDIGFAVTGSRETQSQMMQVFNLAMREARRIDAQEQSQDDELVARTWLDARY